MAGPTPFWFSWRGGEVLRGTIVELPFSLSLRPTRRKGHEHMDTSAYFPAFPQGEGQRFSMRAQNGRKVG